MALDAGTLWFDRQRARRKGGVLLIERGIEDVVIDPTRYGLNRAPNWFLQGIVQWSSVADQVVLCVCPPVVAFARKRETDVVAMEEQYRNWAAVGQMWPFRGKVHEVNTERPVDPTVVQRLVMVSDVEGE